MGTPVEHWNDQLRPLFDGRRVIVKHEVVAGATPTVRAVRDLGATEVLVVATAGTGTGPLPAPDEADWCSFDLAFPTDTVAAIHASNAAVRDPPPHVVARIECFDPDRRAVVLGDFLNEAAELCGRPFLASRRPAWLALDDKTIVDAFWDRCGVDRVPSRIVAASADAVCAAVEEIDAGDGAILNADNADGWTGGGSGVRAVRGVREVAGALAGWTGRGRRVRVMPFLEGIPCSIHGIVFADFVAAFRPVEMVTLRRPRGGFFYAGCATFWDPPAPDRAQMRSAARTVGNALRDDVSYRGAFTIDGVLTRDGFRPTELNPRNGAGLNTMARATEFPLQLVLDAVVGGVDGDWRPAELEALLLSTFDAHRSGGTWRALPVERAPVEDERVVLDGGVAFTYSIGPSAVGSFVRATFDAATFPIGEPAGPHAVDVWAELDRRHDLGLPPLTAALAPGRCRATDRQPDRDSPPDSATG